MHRRLFPTASLVFLTSSVCAHAWQFGVDEGLCTLDHTGAEAVVQLTFDPSLPEYTISIQVSDTWPEGAVFAMRFEGPQGNMISTGRHVLSEDGRTLSVSDRGFGNVLNGLEFNAFALAATGDRVVTLDLSGAAEEVAAFRACVTAPSA